MKRLPVAGMMILGLLLLGGCGGAQSMDSMGKAQVGQPMKTMEPAAKPMDQKPMMAKPASSATMMSQ